MSKREFVKRMKEEGYKLNEEPPKSIFELN